MKFALIGAAGYIAPKHFKAIKEVGGDLVACMDIHDSVGVLDLYFPDCLFFVEMERFERFLRKNPVDYFVVCTPNYLHDSHIWTGLNLGAEVICEKPVVVNPWNLKPLFGKKVNVIQQLRFFDIPDHSFSNISLSYCTPRGGWYDVSWKGQTAKSGGLAYNIGIHFIDLLCYKFGAPKSVKVFEKTHKTMSGRFEFERARAIWFLSIDGPKQRVMKINGNDVSFDGFEDLHVRSYQEILSGRGFKPEDVYTGIETAHKLKEYPCISMKQVS